MFLFDRRFRRIDSFADANALENRIPFIECALEDNCSRILKFRSSDAYYNKRISCVTYEVLQLLFRVRGYRHVSIVKRLQERSKRISIESVHSASSFRPIFMVQG